MLSIFPCVYWPSVCLLWRNVCLGFLPTFLIGLFVFLILTCMSCLYILEINCQLRCFRLFPPILRVVFLFLFIASFALQKLLGLIRSYLLIFVFTSGSGSKRILLWFRSESVLPMFSSKNFIVSGITLKSLIHLEFIFVYDFRQCSSFFLLRVDVQFS